MKNKLSDRSLSVMEDMTTAKEVWLKHDLGVHKSSFKLSHKDLKVLTTAVDTKAKYERQKAVEVELFDILKSVHTFKSENSNEAIVLTRDARTKLSMYIKELEYDVARIELLQS